MKKNFLYIIVFALLLVSQYAVGQPKAVDLGLSVKWASCNLGANAPEDYGDYYAWGETIPNSEYSWIYDWSTYKWCDGSDTILTKYCSINSFFSTVDNKTVLDLCDDAAHVKLGGKWRIPTDAEWYELITECTWTWTVQSNRIGYKVVSNANGKSIFLPAAGYRSNITLEDAGFLGYYWSSNLYVKYPYSAMSIVFWSVDVYRACTTRCYGQSIRPVSK